MLEKSFLELRDNDKRLSIVKQLFSMSAHAADLK
jgi:hypothetical protein